MTGRQQGNSEGQGDHGLTKGEGCCGSEDANRRWMGALNAWAGDGSRAWRLTIDTIILGFILICCETNLYQRKRGGTRRAPSE
jgi:hypothetical protein